MTDQTRHAEDEFVLREDLPEGNIEFRAANNPLLVLEPDGFVYKGVKIEDAGEAYRPFIEWLNAARGEP